MFALNHEESMNLNKEALSGTVSDCVSKIIHHVNDCTLDVVNSGVPIKTAAKISVFAMMVAVIQTIAQHDELYEREMNADDFLKNLIVSLSKKLIATVGSLDVDRMLTLMKREADNKMDILTKIREQYSPSMSEAELTEMLVSFTDGNRDAALLLAKSLKEALDRDTGDGGLDDSPEM